TRFSRDWSSDVCSSDLFLGPGITAGGVRFGERDHVVDVDVGRVGHDLSVVRRGPPAAGDLASLAAHQLLSVLLEAGLAGVAAVPDVLPMRPVVAVVVVGGVFRRYLEGGELVAGLVDVGDPVRLGERRGIDTVADPHGAAGQDRTGDRVSDVLDDALHSSSPVQSTVSSISRAIRVWAKNPAACACSIAEYRRGSVSILLNARLAMSCAARAR